MKRYAQELTAALAQLDAPGWDFEALTCHHVAWAAALLPGALGRQTADRLGRFVRYPRLVKKAKGDVFHVLDHSHANLVEVLPVDKTVISCHDIIPLLAAQGKVPIPASRNAMRRFPQILEQVSRCRAVITISEASRAGILEHTNLTPDRVHVVYLGVSAAFVPEAPEGEREAVRVRYHIPKTAKLLMHVGTGGHYKNLPGVLRLLHALQSRPELTEEVWLLRVGTAFDAEQEALVDSLGLRGRIVQAGKVPTDTELAAHYRAADLFVFPSLWEGFGWPPLEAMACGTPAIVSNVASLPEVVGPEGITHAPNDTEAWAQSAVEILADPTRHAVAAQKARAQAAPFTWERCARQTVGLYQRVATGS